LLSGDPDDEHYVFSFCQIHESDRKEELAKHPYNMRCTYFVKYTYRTVFVGA
jgi:hypothetical protein